MVMIVILGRVSVVMFEVIIAFTVEGSNVSV